MKKAYIAAINLIALCGVLNSGCQQNPPGNAGNSPVSSNTAIVAGSATPANANAGTLPTPPETVEDKAVLFYVDISRYTSSSSKDFVFSDGKGNTITLPAGLAEEHPCGRTLKLPVEKINAKEMALVSEGKRLVAATPKEFTFEEIELVDESRKGLGKKWLAPIDSTPVGISDDGKNIYFAFGFGEGANDVFELTDDGTVRAVKPDDPKIKRGKELEGFPEKSDVSYRKFETSSGKYILKFSYPCT